jgi:hypothetical protein
MSVLDSIFKAANDQLAKTKVWLGGQTADNYLDATPVRDPERDLPAYVTNHKVAGLGECAQRIRYGVGPLIIPFELDVVAPSTISQEPLILGSANQKNIGIYKSATLVGIWMQYSAVLTAGAITLRPQISGADTALQAQLAAGGDPQYTRRYQLTEQADSGGLDNVDATVPDIVRVLVNTDAIVPANLRLNGYLCFNVGEEEQV